MEYKPVKTKFTKKGFTYTQLKREGDKAIFKQVSESKNNIHFEVVIIGRHNGYSLGGNYIEPSETYPSSSEWGVNGWTFCSLESAQVKFDTIET